MRHTAIRRSWLGALLLAFSALCAAHVDASYGKVVLPFEPNLGQADARASFLARGRGVQVFLEPGAAIYRLDGAEQAAVLRLSLVGARRDAEARALEPLPGRSHYLARSHPITNVPHYARVHFSEVYAGIDLAYYGNGSRLEYDFIVAPGADPRRVAIDVEGARQLHIDKAGRLVVETVAGPLVWEAPLAYQERGGLREIVPSRYALRGNRVAFQVAKYDRTLPLTIDPVLAYSTLVGGSGHDRAYGIAVDTNGEAVITGEAGAPDYPTTPGAHDRTSGGVFVTRLNAAGTALVYSTFLGGGRGSAIALRAGKPYVTGATTLSGFGTPGAYVNPIAGARRAFVAQLSADGANLVYGAVLGPQIETLGIAVDAAGAAYVTGTTTSSQFPTTAGAFQPTRPTAGEVYQGDVDSFLVKLNAAGSSLLYATYLGSTHNDLATGIALDAGGRAYVTGTTLGRSNAFESEPAATMPFPTTAGAYQTTFTGIGSAFVTKFDTTQNGAASVVYSTLLGDAGRHAGRAVAVDAAGNAYLTGLGDSNFPLTAGAYGVVAPSQAQPAGSFVAKLSAAGNAIVYGAMIVGADAWKIALDAGGNAFVTGLVTPAHTFVPVNGLAGIGGGSLFLTKLNAGGTTAEYSTYLPGHAANSVAVAVDQHGQAYVSGVAHIAFTTTTGAYQSTITGLATEAFVLKVATNSPPVADAGLDQSVFAGVSFQLNGSGSSDPDGDPLTYEWRDAAGNVVGTTSSVSLTRSQGQYIFVLTVSDGQASSSDAVIVDVAAALTVNLFGFGSGRVQSADGKIDCHPTSSSCSAAYATPTAVMLTPTPDPGSFFFGWTFGCAGTGPCALTVNQNLVVGARFDIQQLTLSVVNNGNGKVTSPTHSAIDCGSACSVTVPYDTEVELIATPDKGYLFDGWSGACSGSATTCKVKLQAAQSVTAAFKEAMLTGISISPATVTVSLGARPEFTLVGTFSDGTTRALSTHHFIEGSDFETCAITRNGLVKCWGQNAPLHTQSGYFGAVSLAAGTGHTCARLADGSVNCQGTNIAGAHGAVTMAAASMDTFAVMPDGSVKSWTYAFNGAYTSPTPVAVPGVQPPGVLPIDVGAEGGPGPCFLLSNGQVSCLHDTAPVPGLSDVVEVRVGVNHACALLADGRVKCWGDNDWGQLGRGTVDPGDLGYWLQAPDFVVETIGGANAPIVDAIGIHAGDYHACALMRDTTVKCWGRQYMSGSTALISPVALTMRRNDGQATTTMTGVHGVAAGAFHTCAAMADGTASCWGINLFNMLSVPGLVGGTEVALPAVGVSNIAAPYWSTTNGAVAAIMASGRAVPKAAGTATVVATIAGFTATAMLQVVNTAAGSNVSVTPTDAATGTSPVTVTFSTVTQPGETTVVINPGAPPAVITTRFGLGNPPVYYDISTTATYTPPITVCIDYTGIVFGSTPALYHFESGKWQDVTTSVNTVDEIVCGQPSSLSPFALLVPDTQPPEIGATVASPAILWPPNHKMTTVTLSVSVADAIDPAPRCRIDSVASNEPVEGLGDGDMAPDWEITADLALKLRAERSGTGSGRIYEVRVRCSDVSGNSSTRAVPVRVPLRR